jgi:hypothetical protein
VAGAERTDTAGGAAGTYVYAGAPASELVAHWNIRAHG